MPLERNAFVRFHYVTVRQSEMLTWVMHDVISSSLGFGTRSMADRHGQDSLAAFIEHFNLLMEAASLSGEYGLTQKLSGALNGVAAYGRKIAKLFTLLVVREERIAIPKAKKIACHRSSPTRVIIEENTLANNSWAPRIRWESSRISDEELAQIGCGMRHEFWKKLAPEGARLSRGLWVG